ncbi:hypothetical protein LPJ53_001810 [Coemansia erecta]|uniref:Uncharacterized protein n=1 Tax=Coemansia erecta TaxID=147472 RepID=A0A9W7XZD5_9FUNG|nr:hypothetical protein LPJ53_001810 [Coemansia erecta]
MTGSQSITPHDYQSLGQALALSAPSCGFPYVTLDISRITAVQKMNVASECGTCLRVETPPGNYIEDGATVGIPGVAMATHFEATTTKFEQLPTTSVSLEKRGVGRSDSVGDQVRYIYVLAVDTGGLGLDMAQVSFTALFGQSLSPTGATWFPVDPEYCQDIWRNTTKEQLKSPTSMGDIPIYTGKSTAPAGLTQVVYSGGGGSGETSGASRVMYSNAICYMIALIFLYVL